MKTITGRDRCRILEKKGWRLVRVRGSRHCYGKGDETAFVLVHASTDLKTGMQLDLMHQAGLTEADL